MSNYLKTKSIFWSITLLYREGEWGFWPNHPNRCCRFHLAWFSLRLIWPPVKEVCIMVILTVQEDRNTAVFTNFMSNKTNKFHFWEKNVLLVSRGLYNNIIWIVCNCNLCIYVFRRKWVVHRNTQAKMSTGYLTGMHWFIQKTKVRILLVLVSK